jgi:hypothetical protein
MLCRVLCRVLCCGQLIVGIHGLAEIVGNLADAIERNHSLAAQTQRRTLRALQLTRAHPSILLPLAATSTAAARAAHSATTHHFLAPTAKPVSISTSSPATSSSPAPAPALAPSSATSSPHTSGAASNGEEVAVYVKAKARYSQPLKHRPSTPASSIATGAAASNSTASPGSVLASAGAFADEQKSMTSGFGVSGDAYGAGAVRRRSSEHKPGDALALASDAETGGAAGDELDVEDEGAVLERALVSGVLLSAVCQPKPAQPALEWMKQRAKRVSAAAHTPHRRCTAAPLPCDTDLLCVAVCIVCG